MKYMYSPTYIASITKCCFVFAFPYAFYRVTKRVKDATDNNQENVIRNCGMWALMLCFCNTTAILAQEDQVNRKTVIFLCPFLAFFDQDVWLIDV